MRRTETVVVAVEGFAEEYHFWSEKSDAFHILKGNKGQ